ncbi:nuclear transport factor 2 family protein [Novosphingobium sp. TH158]|uniref:nuclear transport factor 2 family protein n=1 Tax=Novosphingobium sp. TH158 TaxID=2067455 RepID=UPI001304153C|nr:nuclear transport factor 2 family protein [Novosphingobium sp. TH158]
MTDAYEIQQLINRYTLGVSQPDWDLAIATFADDGEWHVAASGLTLTGREAILKGMQGFHRLFDWFVQVNAPAVIELDGDKARARSVIRENGKFAGRDEVVMVGGVYVDDLVRTGEGWRFARRAFHGAGSFHHPATAGLGF